MEWMGCILDVLWMSYKSCNIWIVGNVSGKLSPVISGRALGPYCKKTIIWLSACLHERSKPNPFIQSTSSTHLTPPIPPSPFVSSPAALWANVKMTNTKKGKMKKFFWKRKAFLTFYPPPLPLYNPLSAFSSKSNLVHVSILTPPPPPLFYLTPLPLIFLSFSSLILFLSILSPPLFTLFLSPLPRFTRSSHLPCCRTTLYLSVATWKATCALIAGGEGGQRVN